MEGLRLVNNWVELVENLFLARGKLMRKSYELKIHCHDPIHSSRKLCYTSYD